jgi:HopA1 effector protein family
VSRYRDQVAAALDAVTIRGPARYAWLGRASRPLPARLAAELDASQRRAYLVSCLREELYWSFYCHGGPGEARWGELQPPFPDPWLVEALSRANAGRGSWERGWTAERVDGDVAVVGDDRLRTRVPLADCRAANGAVRAGAPVEVRLPKELPELSPGYFTVLGDATDPGVTSLVRVYWHVTLAGAADLVAALTRRLNGEQTPFRLKVANHPLRLRRCDAAVLYLGGDAFDAAVMNEIAAAHSACLRPRIPAFTLELAPGVGLAEDRGDVESFGARRCRLLAEAIVSAHERGLGDAGTRLDAVAERFAEDGVEIDAPYLEPSLAGRHVL